MNLYSNYHSIPNKIEHELGLIQLAKKSPEYFAPIYKKYHQSIYRYVYKRMNNKEIVYDIVSQVFMKAISNLHKFEYRGVPFSAWLFRIAKSELYQSYRDDKLDRHVAIDSIQLHDFIEEMEDTCNDLNIDQLKVALGKMKIKDIRLLEMRFFEKLSFKEMGQILELTENNAKVKTFRALSKLKTYFYSKT